MSPGSDQRDDERRITYFAATHTRGSRNIFGIRAVDRGKHMYVIGKTGMGKSTLLENLAIQDIQNGEGICFIDPHGSTAEKLLDFVPHERIKDVLYFAPFDTDFPVGFNVMEDVGYDKRHLVVSGLMGAFKRIWVDAWSARMEYILQNTLLALLEYPDSTLLDVNRMLTNKTFRKAVVECVKDPIVRAFWTEEFATYTDRYTQEATPAIQNKVGQFVSNPLVRNIVGQPKSSFNLREMMDQRKIFIVNLSKGRMGESNAALLGSMLTVKIYLAAMSRADEPASRMAKLPRVYFYVDEFQSMMNEAFADILSESRKYKLALTLANQYIEQMEENVRDAVFGNVGTMICFRVGPFDAEVLKTVFEPTFTAEDLVLLGVGQVYLTLMIDGVGTAPFSAQTIPPIETPSISYRDDVIRSSRAMYGRSRLEIESVIGARQQEFAPPQKEEKKDGDRRFDRPGGQGKPQWDRRDRPRDNGDRGDRPRDERSRGDRPRDDRPRNNRPRDDRPRNDRSHERDQERDTQFSDRNARPQNNQFIRGQQAQRRDEQGNDVRESHPNHQSPKSYSDEDAAPPQPRHEGSPSGAAQKPLGSPERDALRAALASVRTSGKPERSPLEIMREKRESKRQREEHGNGEEKDEKRNVSEGAPELETSHDPVSPEALRRVIYGEDR